MKKLIITSILILIATLSYSQTTVEVGEYAVRNFPNKGTHVKKTTVRRTIYYNSSLSSVNAVDTVFYLSPTGLNNFQRTINTEAYLGLERGETYTSLTINDDSTVVGASGIGLNPIVNLLIIDTTLYPNVLPLVNVTVNNYQYSTTYYVSNSGSDLYTGLEPDSAWQTLSKVEGLLPTFEANTAIALKSGDVWRESIQFPSSTDTLTFTSYGSGAQPIIDGADVPIGFADETGNVWKKTGINLPVWLVYLNDTVGHIQEQLDSLQTEGDFWWDSSDSTFYVYTTKGDPSGNVEVGQRSILFYLKDYNEHITINDLTIQHNNNQTGWYHAAVHTLNSCDNLTITNCTIQENNYYGVFLRNCNNVVLDNNIFLRNGEQNMDGSNVRIYADVVDVSGVAFTNNLCNYAGVNGLLLHGNGKLNHIADIEISANTFDNNYAAGIYIKMLDSMVVYNNTFDNNGVVEDISEDYAIGISSCDNLDVYNNTITNQVFNDAIQLWSEEDLSYGPADNVRIFRNYINNVYRGDGIAYACYDSVTANNLRIFSNVIANADHYGIRSGWNGIGMMDTVHIYNNTLYNNDEGGISANGRGAVYTPDNSMPMEIKNNIIYSTDTLCLDARFISTGLTTSNNLYYRASGNVFWYGDTKYTTATIATFEASAQNTDPLFTDAANGDFTLQEGSPAINNAVDVGLTEDILGNPITGTIGAYEKQ